MATSSNERINELAELSHGFIPEAAETTTMTFLSLIPTTSAPFNPRSMRPLPERRPSGFLSLAPAVSASYPRSRHQSVSHLKKPLPLTHGPHPEEAAAVTAAAPVSVPTSPVISEPKSRRSSSMSSTGSSGSKARLRVLKLGPVHWGEHQGDHKEDWHDVEVDHIEEEVLSP